MTPAFFVFNLVEFSGIEQLIVVEFYFSKLKFFTAN